MKLLLIGEDLKEFLEKVFPGLTKYKSATFDGKLHIVFKWKKMEFKLILHKNKEFKVICWDWSNNVDAFIEELIKETIQKQFGGNEPLKKQIQTKENFQEIVKKIHEGLIMTE